VSDEAAMALICLSELWIRFDNTLYALREKGEWQESIETMRKTHDDVLGKLQDFIYELYEAKQSTLIHKKDEALTLLSDLQVRYTFTLDLLSDRGEDPETIDLMRKIFNDTCAMPRNLIQKLHETT
jgi:hypothetical protein